MACSPEYLKDTLGQHVLEQASFSEVQPLAEERVVWWSTEDSDALVDLTEGEEDSCGNDDFKEEPEDPPEDSYSDGDDDSDASTDYSVFYRFR
jgi:hypothetical protein